MSDTLQLKVSFCALTHRTLKKDDFKIIQRI